MIRGTVDHAPLPFMRRSTRDLKVVLPSQMDLDEFIRLQRKAWRKEKDPERKHKLNLILIEFEKLREQLS